MTIKPAFGVSPAYFLSRFGAGFSPRDVRDALPDIGKMGFDAFQLEIVAVDKFPAWLSGGMEDVRSAARDAGLFVSAAVAHFALPAFADEKALSAMGAEGGLDDIETLFRLAADYGGVRCVSLPLGPYSGPRNAATIRAFRNKLAAVAELREKYRLPLAVEVQPGAFVAHPESIVPLLEELDIGLNLDTGHAFAAGFDPGVYPPALKGRILTTHLCDNDGVENLSLTPGKGGIDFPRVVAGLRDNGYANSYDLEIFCPPDAVLGEYTDGLARLKAWLA